ncbi:MAG: Ig-like domain-containing protein [Candidatus Thermoplasmatota archaeon]
MNKKLITVCTVLVVLILIGIVYYFTLGTQDPYHANKKPIVTIVYPSDHAVVSQLVMISGTASDPDGDQELISVEIKIGNTTWTNVSGLTQWSYTWIAYSEKNADYMISVRAYDGKQYSKISSINVTLENPKNVSSDGHKWALFVAAANFPKENESKLGNGGLYLAEEMAAYFITHYNYATENIVILFDDGWIRKDNGYGERIETLQQRKHSYAVTYGASTKDTFIQVVTHLVNQANSYRDSEVFIWIFNHGYGDASNSATGGKLFERSQIFLWDGLLSDRDLGKMLFGLRSKKTTLIVDACYSGGFADKTIYDFSTSLLFKSGIPRSGRIVISSTSKFRQGYASTTQGPLFTLLWFEGIKTGDADGFKPGFLKRGVPSRLHLFKDGKVSVEEAFYYAKYMLRTDKAFAEYKTMEPQINDKYPYRVTNRKGLILGET